VSGAVIGGQLSCVRGQFETEHGDAFAAQNARVAEVFYWRDVTVKSGSIRLTDMQVGGLADDEKSWPSGGPFSLSPISSWRGRWETWGIAMTGGGF